MGTGPRKTSITVLPRHLRPARARDTIRQIIRSYDDLVTRLYSVVRFGILRQHFLEEIGQYLPREGHILDLGCGFGLFSLYYASLEPDRRLLGVDLDHRRIERAKASARKLELDNVEYQVANVLQWQGHDRFDAVYCLDLLHHLPRDQVLQLLTKVRALLRPGGILLIKDVADTPRYKMLFTLLLDRLMVGMEPIRYWPPDELSGLLEDELGLSVHRHRLNDFLPYPHVLYVAR